MKIVEKGCTMFMKLHVCNTRICEFCQFTIEFCQHNLNKPHCCKLYFKSANDKKCTSLCVHVAQRTL